MRVAIIAVLVIGLASSLPAGTWKRVTSSRCGISLEIPTSWSLANNEWGFASEKDCAVGLKPRDWDTTRENSEEDISEFAVHVGVSRGSVRELCAKDIACKDDEGWFISGRGGARGHAEEHTAAGVTVITGTSEVGAYRKGGGYMGWAEAPVGAVVTHGYIIEFIGDSKLRDEAVFRRVVRSVRVRSK